MADLISDEEKYELTHGLISIKKNNELVENNDIERLLLMVDHENDFAVSALTWNKNLPLEVLNKIVESGRIDPIRHAINHPNMSDELVMKLYYAYGNSNTEVAFSLAGSNRISLEQVEYLLKVNDSPDMRYCAARRSDMTLDLLKLIVKPWTDLEREKFQERHLDFLMKKIYGQIVLGFYYNEYKNINNDFGEIADLILENTDKSDYKVEPYLLFEKESGLSKQLIEKYSKNILLLNERSRKALAGNPLTPVEHLEELIHDESKSVILALASNVSAGEYVHNYLLHTTKNYKVKMEIAKVTTNIDILYTILSRTKSEQILQAGQLNPLYEQLQGRI